MWKPSLMEGGRSERLYMKAVTVNKIIHNDICRIYGSFVRKGYIIFSSMEYHIHSLLSPIIRASSVIIISMPPHCHLRLQLCIQAGPRFLISQASVIHTFRLFSSRTCCTSNPSQTCCPKQIADHDADQVPRTILATAFIVSHFSRPPYACNVWSE